MPAGRGPADARLQLQIETDLEGMPLASLAIGTLKLHRQIVENIEKRDPAATSKLLIELLDGAEADVRRSLAARLGRQK